jgi:hypothetical protein
LAEQCSTSFGENKTGKIFFVGEVERKMKNFKDYFFEKFVVGAQ